MIDGHLLPMARQVIPTMPAAMVMTDPAKSGSRHTGALELLSKLILLGAPVFYVLGRVYTEGYWSALGVSPSVMGVEAEDYIYFGFVVIVNGLAMVLPRTDNAALWLAPMASIFLLIALGTGVWTLSKIKAWLVPRLRKSGRRMRAFCARKKSALEALATAGSILGALSSVALAFLLISAALLVPIVIANSVGKMRAGQLAKELKAGKTSHAYVVASSVDGFSGRVVDCTGKYCVVYARGHFTPVPQQEVRWRQPDLGNRAVP